jgi:hypothetical protein
MGVRYEREKKMTDVLLRNDDFPVEQEDELLYRGLRGAGATGRRENGGDQKSATAEPLSVIRRSCLSTSLDVSCGDSRTGCPPRR